MDLFHNILAIRSWSTAHALILLIPVKGFFGVPLLYVLGFLGKLLLLFFISAVISKILNLDKAYDDHPDKNG